MPDACGEVLPSIHVALIGVVGDLGRALRHDLSPVEASQIAGIFLSNEAVGDHDVFPAIVVEIGKD